MIFKKNSKLQENGDKAFDRKSLKFKKKKIYFFV